MLRGFSFVASVPVIESKICTESRSDNLLRIEEETTMLEQNKKNKQLNNTVKRKYRAQISSKSG